MVQVAEKCENQRMSTKSIGIIIRSAHMMAPFMFVMTLLFAPFFLCILSLVGLAIVATLFYTYDACFLSILEQKLCQDDFVIFDPALELFQMEINTTNRYRISNMIAPIYIALIGFIFYVRFYSSKTKMINPLSNPSSNVFTS